MNGLPIDLVMKATALLAAAALADVALGKRASAATRHLVWSLAIATLLVLPIAGAALPSWQVRIPVAPAAIPVTPTANAPVAATPGVRSRFLRENRDLTPAQEAPAAPRLTWSLAAAALPIVYALGVLLLLARLVVEPLALRRLARDAAPVTDPVWRQMLRDSARQLGIVRDVRLLQGARDVMPLTFGTLTPSILLPVSAGEWSDERRRAVLLHELAHVARIDCLIQRLTAVACAFYWPHPGVWWAARRLRVERELACDDRVLAAGEGAREYAGHLLELARSLGSAPAPATAIGMARARQLEGRLLAILDAARNRASLRRRGLGVALGVSCAIVLPLAVLRAAVVPAEAAPAGTPAAEPAPPLTLASFLQEDTTGTWELRRTRDPNVVQVTIRTAHGNHGRTVSLDRLAGLPVDQISAPRADVHFPIRREAGTFTVDGVCRSGVCGGTFAFEADPKFADELAKRGIGRPTPQDQFSFAIADIGVTYLDALTAGGYRKPDLTSLVRAAQHGVDRDYLRAMTDLGYRFDTLDQLTQLRDHGVDPEYVRGMAANGFTRLSADELLRARDHGVDPQYVKGMADNGIARLSLDDLIRTRDHGIDPHYIGGLAAQGYRGLSLDALISLRDHGVDPEYIKGMAAHGIARLSLDDLVRLRNHGVDPEYVSGMAALGYRGLTIDALVNARNHGVDPYYIRGMADLGYKGESLDTWIRMRDHGVDPEYVRRLQRNGVSRLSVDELIRRRDRGEDSPDAAVQQIAARIGSAWRAFNTWLPGQLARLRRA